MKEFSLQSLHGKMILFATILASGMAFLDGSVINIAIPAIQNQLNTSITGIQWIVNSYALMLCALILVSGALSDRYGRKKYSSQASYYFFLHQCCADFPKRFGNLLFSARFRELVEQ